MVLRLQTYFVNSKCMKVIIHGLDSHSLCSFCYVISSLFFLYRFFRLHFALNDISYASLVPGRSVAYGNEVKQVFSIVARAPRETQNSVIVLAELEQGQPANAIVSFILRVVAWQH